MDGETWAAIAAAAIALGALYFNWRSTQAAIRAAGATENQTEIQRQQTEVQRQQTDIQREQTILQQQVHFDAMQPYIWADVRPDDAQGTLLQLVVGNSGPTVATNVRVLIDPPLQTIDQFGERIEAVQARLARGIDSLPPGRKLVWALGQGFNLLTQERTRAYTFMITAEGPSGPVPQLTYVVDLSDLEHVMDQPGGSLHQLTKVLKEISKKMQ